MLLNEALRGDGVVILVKSVEHTRESGFIRGHLFIIRQFHIIFRRFPGDVA